METSIIEGFLGNYILEGDDPEICTRNIQLDFVGWHDWWKKWHHHEKEEKNHQKLEAHELLGEKDKFQKEQQTEGDSQWKTVKDQH